MADSEVVIHDANEVDRNIDTRTIGTDHRQVVVVGDPATAAGVAPVDGTNGLAVDVKAVPADLAVQLTDGTDIADVLDLTNSNPLTVAVVDSAGTQITSFGGSGGTAEEDDADFTAGSGGTHGTPIMGVYESSPSSVTAGDLGIAGITQQRLLKVSVDASSLDVAHDDADTGNPALVGTRAQSSWPTAVSNADRARAISDLYGRVLIGYRPPELQKSYHVNYTTTQTGTVIWTPASGKKIAVESCVVSTYGTTGGKVSLFFDDDTTYNAGTDQPLLIVNFIPSATVYPGAVFALGHEVHCLTADYSLRVTTSAGISLDITVHGYEF